MKVKHQWLNKGAELFCVALGFADINADVEGDCNTNAWLHHEALWAFYIQTTDAKIEVYIEDAPQDWVNSHIPVAMARL